SRIVLWVNDTVIVKKMLDQQSLYYVADAVTGAPIANADVEFFGWRTVQVKPNVNQFNVVTTKFSEKTNNDGQLVLGQNRLAQDYQWLITSTTRPAADGRGRFAYLGFTNVWYQPRHDQEYNADRTFIITDRPVYRPENTVNFKMWTQHSKYDQPDVSSF